MSNPSIRVVTVSHGSTKTYRSFDAAVKAAEKAAVVPGMRVVIGGLPNGRFHPVFVYDQTYQPLHIAQQGFMVVG